MAQIDPRELSELYAFADRGGIGRGVALCTFIAQKPEELMYMEGDELVILRVLGDLLLASCDTVIGWANRKNIRFVSLAGSSSPPRPQSPALLPSPPSFGASQAAKDGDKEIPRTVISSPSPPKAVPANLYPADEPDTGSPTTSKHSSAVSAADTIVSAQSSALATGCAKMANSLELPKMDEQALRRVSDPFELELQRSPGPSPSIDSAEKRFEYQQDEAAAQETAGRAEPAEQEEKLPEVSEPTAKVNARDSIMSDASSALGGIGGFMMGTELSDQGTPMLAQGSDSEELDEPSLIHGNALSSSTSTAETPLASAQPSRRESNVTDLTHQSVNHESTAAESEDWDIYGDYARDSMYGPALRASIYAKRASRAAAIARQSALPPLSPDMKRLASQSTPNASPTEAVRRGSPGPSSPAQTRAAPVDRMSGFRVSDAWSEDEDGESGPFAAARRALEKVAARRHSDDDQDEEAKPTATAGVAGPSAVPARPERRRPSAIDSAAADATRTPGQSSLSAAVTPRVDAAPSPRTPLSAPFSARSIAMEIRNRARREQEAADQHPDDIPPPEIIRRSTRTSPVKVATSPPVEATDSAASPETQSPITYSTSPQAIASSLENVSQASQPSSPPPYSSPEILQAPAEPEAGATSPVSNRSPDSGRSENRSSQQSTASEEIITPMPPTEATVPSHNVPVVVATPAPEDVATLEAYSPSLLASPFSLSNHASRPSPPLNTFASPDLAQSPAMSGRVAKTPVTARVAPSSPQTPGWNPPPSWSPLPGSPVSPHSIAIVRTAAEMVRKGAAGSPGVCIVGRVEADLLASEGPVPIAFMLGAPGPVVNHPSAVPITPKSRLRIGLGPAPPSNLGPGLRTPDQGSSRGTSPTAPRPISPLAATPEASTTNVNAASPFPEMRKPLRSVTSPGPSALHVPISQAALQPPFSPLASPSVATRQAPSPIVGPMHPPIPVSPLAHSVGSPAAQKLPVTPAPPAAEGSKSGGFMRGRSKSFSATVSKAFGGKKKEALTIDTSAAPPLPSEPSPNASQPSPSNRRPTISGSLASQNANGLPMPSTDRSTFASKASTSSSFYVPPPTSATTSNFLMNSPEKSASARPPLPTRSSSHSISRGSFKSASKGPTLPADVLAISPSMPVPSGRSLPSPVSHKDFADQTVKADGLDFELVQPKKKSSLLSPVVGGPPSPADDGSPTQSPSTPAGHLRVINGSPSSPSQASLPRLGSGGLLSSTLKRANTQKSNLSGWSGASGSSVGHLADTDEWGFLKDVSPNPEIFQSRNEAVGHRQAEQKWLAIISQPLPSGETPPKKVRKLVLEAGVPSSLRGKVWEWFMASTNTAKQPGLYHQLLDHERDSHDSQIEHDVATAYADHSLYADPASPGQADLRHILLAHQAFASAPYRLGTCLLAGALLIHCVAEDAFWLLQGLMNGPLRGYYSREGDKALRVDARVLSAVVQGSELKLSRHLRDCGVMPIDFVEKWFTQMFIRVLPWPTALRVIDAVVSEDSRYLLVAALTILTLSRDRILALKSRDEILRFLNDLPQDALLLPETFMKACGVVKLRDEDLKKLREGVEASGTI